MVAPHLQYEAYDVTVRGKLVHFGPRLSMTAANADVFLPLAPGTEGLAALAIARVMVDEKLGDAAAGKAATAFGASGWPYLIIVGKDGKVKVRVSGEISVADLNDVVTKAMAA